MDSKYYSPILTSETAQYFWGAFLPTRETSQVLFFPSLDMAAATLVLIGFRSDDAYALDLKLGRTLA